MGRIYYSKTYESTIHLNERENYNLILSRNTLTQAVPYFCIRCRSRLFHVNKDVMVVWQGEGYPEFEIPQNMGLVQNKCHGCETIYNFYFQ